MWCKRLGFVKAQIKVFWIYDNFAGVLSALTKIERRLAKPIHKPALIAAPFGNLGAFNEIADDRALGLIEGMRNFIQ